MSRYAGSAALLVLTACQPAAPDPRGVNRDETLLTVSASGRSEARPDEARLSLGVSSRGGSSAEAVRLNAEKMNRVTAALARLGVKPDDLQTRTLQLGRIDYGPERGSFRAENVVEVRLRDARRVGEAVAATAEAGANLLSGPDLRVSDREAASRSAYASIEGVVESISRDAIQITEPRQNEAEISGSRSQPSLIYAARIRLRQRSIDIAGRKHSIGSGLAIQAEIVTGSRRIIEYLLSPIAKSFDEAARER